MEAQICPHEDHCGKKNARERFGTDRRPLQSGSPTEALDFQMADAGKARAGKGDTMAERLQAAQREREQIERQLADAATDAHETAQHRRRAEKAHYLRKKLEERAASERGED